MTISAVLLQRTSFSEVGKTELLLSHSLQVATEVVLGGHLETWIVHCRRDKEVSTLCNNMIC
jgi:hypothetical protein